MKSLFDSTMLSGISMKNRFIRSATWLRLADEKGHLTERLFDALKNVAKGGVALLFTGYAFVTEHEQPNPGMLGVYNDSFIPEYQRLTKMIHDNGSKIGLQIAYGGSFTTFNTGKRIIWGPSDIPNPVTNVVPKEMTKEDIGVLIDAFAQAARRAKESRFDCVQVHAAHGYLLNQFLTPFYNRRTDEYGGKIENRARIIFEILESIRSVVGSKFPVMIKIHGSDQMKKGGLTIEDSIYVCKELDRRGIDAIEISGGHRSKDSSMDPKRTKLNDPEKQSYFKEEAAQIADNVRVPVILVGGNRSPAIMTGILNNTAIEYFSFCRTILSEPNLINTWYENPSYKPRCLSCNDCFDDDGNICVFVRKSNTKKK